MQSFLSVLVIVGALFVFRGKRRGRNSKEDLLLSRDWRLDAGGFYCIYLTLDLRCLIPYALA